MLDRNEELIDLLGRVYEAAGDPTLWAPFIEELAGRTKADSAGLRQRNFGPHIYIMVMFLIVSVSSMGCLL
jgi:hypothetical protein